MRLIFSAITLVVSAIPVALSQGANVTFVAGLLGTLEGRNLSSFVTIAHSINSSGVGQYLLANISNGQPHVLFVPNNEALANAPENVTTNPDILTDVVGYHIVPGNFSGTIPSYPNTTVGRTLLTDPKYVQLEGGNKAQAVVWSLRDDGRTHVLNQKNDTAVVDLTTYENLTIYIINQVLENPESLSLTVQSLNDSLASDETILQQVEVPFFNATTNSTANITLFNALDSGWHGFTFFAPNMSALTDAAAQLQGLSSNSTALQAVIFNHIINGTTYYSPQLVNTNFTSMAGETLFFSINSTGKYVTSGNTTAVILQPDVLLPNGVIHIIDRLLINAETNSSAASSALASATSAATIVVSETGPIGFSQTVALNSPSASTTGGGIKSSGAERQITGAGAMIASVLFGMAFGGFILLG